MFDGGRAMYGDQKVIEQSNAALLVCGILSSLLYVVANLLGAMRWKGYSSTSQAISELMAIDAPSRPIVVPIFLAYDVLMIAFALGVWKSAGANRALRTVAGLLLAYGVIGSVGLFAPMHQRGMKGTLTDTLHILATVALVSLILVMIGFGARAFGKVFRVYSIVTILLLLVFGVLASLNGPRLAANLPTPWLGITERINVGAFLLWVVVLAFVVLARRNKQSF